MTLFIRATAIVFLAAGLAACNQAPATNPNVELAKAWVTAASTSRTAAMEMIETNMAEDGRGETKPGVVERVVDKVDDVQAAN